jgi:TonB-linked SusC/RagA family outer membrane protein
MGIFYAQRRLPQVFIPLLFLFLFVQVHAQDRTVNGTVTSAEDGSGVPGVSIIITGTTTGTITDMDGNYKLNVPEGGSLTFSSVGFVSQVIEVGAQSVIDIVLAPDVTELSEVVVIGYGTREKKDLTGAVASMGSEEIEQAITFSPDMAMQGRMAGVLVTQPDGLLNNRPQVRIRGVNTFGIADPLYVIDGVPVTEYGSGYEQNQAVVRDIRGRVNILTLINPDDIESISVLKDASAAAIYGVRAANGVILITTKQGKKNTRPKIDFAASYGVSNVPKTLDVLDVPDYVDLYQESFGANPNFTLPGIFNPDSTNAISRYDRYLGDKPFIDWQDPFLTKNAGVADASVRIYGGSENTNYYVSTGYTTNEGNYLGNNMERYSLATNVTTRAVDWLEVGVTYRFAYVETLDMYADGSPYSLSMAYSAPPWQPIYIEDDFYNDNEESDLKYGYANTVDSVTSPNPAHPMWGGDDDEAPPYLVDFFKKYGEETTMNQMARYNTKNGWPYVRLTEYALIRNIGNAYLLVEPIKGLTFKGSIALDWYYNRRNSWGSVDTEMYSITPNNPYSEGDGTSKGGYGERHSRNFNRVLEFTANWIKSFGDHNINLTLNTMDQQYQYEMISGSSEQQASEDPDKWTMGGPREYTDAGDFYDRFALQGYMGRLSYNYASKYYLDATVRYDGSSRFAPGYRWGTFPSFALAWRISAENFMSNVTFINDLKLRGGWGQMGNQETRPFAYLSTVSTSPVISQGSGDGNPSGTWFWGVKLPDFPTEDLSWETTTTINAGFDAIFWNNRFNLTVEYYEKLTEGILQAVQLPASVGNQNDPILNIADVSNKGWEFQLGYNQRFGEVDVSFSGNFTTVKNNVESVWNDQPFGGQGGRIEEGYPINYLWGFQADGIYQSSEEVLQWWSVKKDSQADSALVSPGDMYFKDIHGAPDPDNGYDYYTPFPDSVVDLNDRTYIGKTIAGYYYGFTFGANWKGIDLSIFFQGVGDIQKYASAFNAGISFGGTGNNMSVDALNRWTPDNRIQYDGSSNSGKAASITRAVRADPGSNMRYSDRLIHDAGFMRLKNLTIGYTLPAKWMNQTNAVERIRFYFSGQNLATFSSWQGLDPEASNEYYPIPRSWIFGLNATF